MDECRIYNACTTEIQRNSNGVGPYPLTCRWPAPDFLLPHPPITPPRTSGRSRQDLLGMNCLLTVRLTFCTLRGQ